MKYIKFLLILGHVQEVSLQKHPRLPTLIVFVEHQRLKIPNAHEKSNLIFLSEFEAEQTYDAFKKDIGIVNIFFGKEKISRYLTSNRMSNSEFLVQIGGSLGFYMGVSIISVIEIFYWFTFRLFRNQ